MEVDYDLDELQKDKVIITFNEKVNTFFKTPNNKQNFLNFQELKKKKYLLWKNQVFVTIALIN